MILGVVLALVSALAYGVSDFFGTVGARRLGVVPATTISYAFATVVLAVATPFSGGDWSLPGVLSGAVAGVFAVVGLLCFFGALALGPISVLSPFIAMLSASVPVAAAAVRGAQLSFWAWVAIGLAFVSGLLISTSRHPHAMKVTPRAAVLSLASGATLGLSIVALNFAPRTAGLVPALMEIGVGLVLLLLTLAALRLWWPAAVTAAPGPGDSVRALRRALVPSASAGVLLGAANGVLIVALYAGNLAVVSVLVGLYPLATIVLARAVLKERMTLSQGIGAGIALIASVILASN